MENLTTEVDILDEAKDNFLTYAEEVLTDRAVPAAEDGLLSAQRKILWTMEDYLKMDSKSKTKKCNALIGSTLATSYFHGDAACYGVLCKMSQKYLMRYPLIHPQGNLGSQENNEMVASSRYTEARPSAYADLMFNDFKKKVVPMKETYNGEFMEPVILPSLFPNAICNGRQAIGVSMAHNSAPCNLTEVCNAAIALIEKGKLTTNELMNYIPGPDFPLGGTVLNSRDIKTAFETGKSSVSLKIRGDYQVSGRQIIFTTIPYRTYRNKIKEQINKNIDTLSEYIDDFDDESNIGDNRLVFYVKSGVTIQDALERLFAYTDLQTTLSYNMNFIVNGTPKLCSMLDLLKIYVDHQEQVLIKATEFDKAKAEARIHILEGLVKAIDKIDEVIAIIKGSKGKADARTKLIVFLQIDEIQANAILDMKLGNLTRIDKEEISNELTKKKKFVAECVEILTKQEVRNQKLIEKITWLRDTYGDARRTKLLDVEIPNIKKQQPVVIEDCMVVVSPDFMVKRIPLKDYKPQRANSASYVAKTNTGAVLNIFTNRGKLYKMPVDIIAEGTNISKGSYLRGSMKMTKEEIPILYAVEGEAPYVFIALNNGIVKRTSLEEYVEIKKTGVKFITLRDGEYVAAMTLMDQEEVILVTEKGMSIRFTTADMTVSGRVSRGVKGMKLEDGDKVIAVLPIKNPDDFVAIASKYGICKRVKLKEFRTQSRGGKGALCGKGEVFGVAIVSGDEDIIVQGEKTSVTVPAKDFPITSRTTYGNIILRDDVVVGMQVLS